MLAVLALVAAVLAPAASAQSRPIGTVVIANGWSSADSAVASALAALKSNSSTDAVVLYASKNDLTTRTENFIRDRAPSEVILVGGTAALTATVEAQADRIVGSDAVTRIEGRDRFDTAAKAVPSNATTFIVANGYSAADTGVAAALAATKTDAAVLLATTNSLTDATERIIRSQRPAAVEFVGGTAVLAESLVERVLELAPQLSRVPRHSGASRTDTAAAAVPSGSSTLVIANGWSPADMGVAAAYAAITDGAAVLYTQKDLLATAVVSRIRALTAERDRAGGRQRCARRQAACPHSCSCAVGGDPQNQRIGSHRHCGARGEPHADEYLDGAAHHTDRGHRVCEGRRPRRDVERAERSNEHRRCGHHRIRRAFPGLCDHAENVRDQPDMEHLGYAQSDRHRHHGHPHESRE